MVKEIVVTDMYEVAEAATVEALRAAVVELQKKGYVPQGGIVAAGKKLLQAMVQR